MRIDKITYTKTKEKNYMNYPLVAHFNDISKTPNSPVVGVGTERYHKVYFIHNGNPIFVKNILGEPKHPVYSTKEEAMEQSDVGSYVGVGYPKIHNVYRVSESKDEHGNLMKILNLSYHYHA